MRSRKPNPTPGDSKRIREDVAMPSVPDKLTVTITKTAGGGNDYVQVMSGDQFSINVVLIAKKIVVEDRRDAK